MYKIDQSFGSIGKAPVPRTNGSNLFYCFPSWQTFNLGVTNTLLGEKRVKNLGEQVQNEDSSLSKPFINLIQPRENRISNFYQMS